eukprot:3058217-Rhodomonas_salina.1
MVPPGYPGRFHPGTRVQRAHEAQSLGPNRVPGYSSRFTPSQFTPVFDGHVFMVGIPKKR